MNTMAGGPPRRVLIVDDDEQLTRLVGEILERDGHQVVGCVASFEEAIEAAPRANVAVVDLRLGGKSGFEVSRELVGRGVRVLIYTGARDRESLLGSLQTGALGVALKGDPISELSKAVKCVGAGRTYIAPDLRRLVVRQSGGRLTPREREVLFLLATGLKNQELAEALGLSPETTRTHLKTAMRKLDARTRVHAVTLAGSQGEITLP